MLFSLIMLLGAAQGLFLALALLNARGGNLIAHRLLAALTLAFAWDLFDEFLLQTRYYAQATFLLGVENPLDLIYGPLALLYVKALTSPLEFRLTVQYLWHFLPLGVGLTLMIPFFALDSVTKLKVVYGDVAVVDRQLALALMGYMFVLIGGIVQIGVYLGLSVRQLSRHTRKIREQFSYTERISLNWVRNLLLIWCGLYLIYVAQSFSMFMLNMPAYEEKLSNVLMLLIATMIYTMGLLGLRQPAIFARLAAVSQQTPSGTELHTPLVEVQPQASGEEKYKKSALNTELSEALLTQLLAHMEAQKPYLDGELTLPQLAQRLELTPNYLSQVINGRLGQNFFDFINHYRIEEAKRRLSDPTEEQGNVLTLALEAGFNSKSAFYTAFKKHTGMTPSQFKKAAVESK